MRTLRETGLTDPAVDPAESSKKIGHFTWSDDPSNSWEISPELADYISEHIKKSSYLIRH